MQTIPLFPRRPLQRRTPRRLRVLLAVPDAALRDLVTAYFRIVGVDVISTDSGTEAVTLAVVGDPHVAVLAPCLLGTDVDGVIENLRSVKRTRHLPLVLWMGRPPRGALEAGGPDVVARKPCAPSELLATIRSLVGELRFS